MSNNSYVLTFTKFRNNVYLCGVFSTFDLAVEAMKADAKDFFEPSIPGEYHRDIMVDRQAEIANLFYTLKNQLNISFVYAINRVETDELLSEEKQITI